MNTPISKFLFFEQYQSFVRFFDDVEFGSYCRVNHIQGSREKYNNSNTSQISDIK